MLFLMEWFGPLVAVTGLLAALTSLYFPFKRIYQRVDLPSCWFEKHEAYAASMIRLWIVTFVSLMLIVVFPSLILGEFVPLPAWAVSIPIGGVAVWLHLYCAEKLRTIVERPSLETLTSSEKYKSYVPFLLIIGGAGVNLYLFPTSLDTPKMVTYAGFVIVAMFYSSYQLTFLKFLGLIRIAPDPIRQLAAKLELDHEKVFEIRTGQSNAFLSRKNEIYVTTALIESLSNEEISAVIAHEKGHVDHVSQMNRQSMIVSITNLLALGCLKCIPLNPVWGLLGIAVAIFIPQIVYKNRHRYEYEADAYAAQACGAEAMASALKKINRTNGSSFIRKSATHPCTYDRMEALEMVSEFTRPLPQKFPWFSLVAPVLVLFLFLSISLFTMIVKPEQTSLTASIETSLGQRSERGVAFVAADFIEVTNVAEASRLLGLADQRELDPTLVRIGLSFELAKRDICDMLPTDYFGFLNSSNESSEMQEINADAVRAYERKCGGQTSYHETISAILDK